MGKDQWDTGAFDLKAFATGNDRCPVITFNAFVSYRPKTMCEDEAPLFLQVRYNIDINSELVWYCGKALGKNSIGDLLGKVRSLLKTENSNKRKISNYSSRKPTINPLHIQQISDHLILES